jgi:uncharacterized membrane protein YbjE (DUF340 family)
MSRLLIWAATVLAASETLSSEVTSSLRVIILGLGRLAASAADLISGIRESSEERAAMIIVDAPAFAKLMAVARPTPFEAPVMRTDLPARLKFEESMAGMCQYVLSARSPGLSVCQSVVSLDYFWTITCRGKFAEWIV